MLHDHVNNYRFIDVMIALGEASGQESTTLKEKIYAQGLEDIAIEEIEKAAWLLIKTRTFASFPKIGEIRDAVGGKAEDCADVQASIVWQTVTRYGGARSVVFDDPVTMAVIQQGFGGWQKMCSELLIDQMQWFLKDFVKHYIAFKRSNMKHIGYLAGYSDPVRLGITEGPAMIGDQQKCLDILEQAKETPLIGGFTVTQIADKLGI